LLSRQDCARMARNTSTIYRPANWPARSGSDPLLSFKPA